MLKNVFKGIIIGFANIIPGVSGGILAVSMGIYDKLIYCINHFFKDIVKNIIFLAPIVLGMGIAMVACAFGLDYLFEIFPVQTNLLFIGLILGSLPTIYGKVRGSSIKLGYIIAAMIFFVVVIGMALFNGASGNEKIIEMSFSQNIILFLIGIIASITIVVPGVSGSMILLLLGYYNPILKAIKEFVVAFIHFDINAILSSLYILLPFGIGTVAGVIALAKAIEIVFRKFTMYAYWSILGLLIASPFAIIIVGNFPEIRMVHVCTGIVSFVLGWFVSRRLGD